MLTKKQLKDTLLHITDNLMPVMVLDRPGYFKVVFKDEGNSIGIDINIDTSYNMVNVTKFNVAPYRTMDLGNNKVRFDTIRWYKDTIINIIDTKKGLK